MDEDHARGGWSSAIKRAAEIDTGFSRAYASYFDTIRADAAISARYKLLFLACCAAARGVRGRVGSAMHLAVDAGLQPDEAWAGALTMLMSRGDPAFSAMADALGDVDDSRHVHEGPLEGPHEGPIDVDAAKAYFERAFDAVPPAVQLLADHAPTLMAGYAAMRSWALEHSPLSSLHVELLLVAVNVADYQDRLAEIHARGARSQGATEAQLLEAVICAVPVAGLPAHISGSNAIFASRD